MKKLLILLLLGFSTVFTLHNVIIEANSAELTFKKLPDIENYVYVDDEVLILGNFKETSKARELSDYLTNDNIVFIYNLDGNVKDLLYNIEYEGTFGIVYYYDEYGTLNRERLTIDDISDKNLLYFLDENFSNSYKKIKELKNFGDKKSVDKTITTNFVRNVSLSSTCNFGAPRLSDRNTIINENYGYLVLDTLLFRCDYDGINFYRVENKVQFTSGRAAVEEPYNDEYVSSEALISGTLEKHVDYGYGTWYSNQPMKVDYWPKNDIVYSTITSGINVNLTLGRTQQASISGATDGFGIDASSEMNSSIGLGYFYQATKKFTKPNMNAQWLSMSEGAAWEYTDFDNEPDKAVTVYPGILIEVEPNPYSLRSDGEYHFDVSFEVIDKRIFPFPDIKQIISSNEIVILDNQL